MFNFIFSLFDFVGFPSWRTKLLSYLIRIKGKKSKEKKFYMKNKDEKNKKNLHLLFLIFILFTDLS